MIGQRLGHYQVTGKLGVGGMGVVYRAHDTRLGRYVALKMLPETFLHDSGRRARFEREAHVLASLNHPNIASIYGLEESGNGRALVMELVEGATLAERIGSGPVPLEEALVIARQIAEAIEFAHERGFVHRDLKPTNVKLTHDNTVKVLDFGLAKAFSEDRLSSDPENSPTITQAATRAGVVLGTAAYMAPEQAKGKPVDRRADIWAFGIVLMEMLTGRQTYSGETAAETLALVMTKDPALDQLPPETPPAIRRLLRRCLDRDPRRRLRDIGEARIAIEEVLSGTPPEPAVPSGPSASPSPSRPLVWMASTGILAVLLLASLAALVGHFRETPPKASVVRFQVPLPEKASLRSLDFPVVSPNGEYLAFAARIGPGSTTGGILRVQPLNSLSFQDLPGTEDAMMPFWSPDSRSIGFFTEGKLKKVDLTGGPPQTICDVAVGQSGAWSPDGTIVFATYVFPTSPPGHLRRVPAAGGEATPLSALDSSRQEIQHGRPFFLPDGRSFLYLAVSSQPEKSGIYAGSLDSKDTKRLMTSSSHAAYAPGLSGAGYLMFSRANTLMAQPFDSRKLELSGEPFPIAEQVAEAESVGSAFSVSGNGVLAYRSGGAGGNTELVWFDRSGKRLQSVGDPAVYSNPALSPDEKRLAVDRRDPRTAMRDIWTFDLVRKTASRLTFDSGDDSNAAWSPDGARIAFASNRKGHRDLYQKLASGTGEDELLLESAERKAVEDWSPDGRFLLYTQESVDVWVLPLFGERSPFPFLKTSFSESQPQFSPNGRWVVYSSNESGRSEIYVQAFPPTGDKWPISTAGGSDPQWRFDGKELFYLERQKMMAVPVNTGGPAFEAGIPAALFMTPIPVASRRNRYVVAANGQRFLVNTVPEQLQSVFTVVLNWEAGVKR